MKCPYYRVCFKCNKQKMVLTKRNFLLKERDQKALPVSDPKADISSLHPTGSRMKENEQLQK